jgi:hypothetical protein
MKNKAKEYITIKLKPEALKNIDFGVSEECYSNDKTRLDTYQKQRFENGFDDTETWHLDRTFALFMIPRLKRFLEVNNGIPIGETEESYNNKIKFIIEAFEDFYATNKYFNSADISEREELMNRAKQAVEYLSKLWFDLWW